MTQRVQRLLDRAKKREGSFWLRGKWISESLNRSDKEPMPVRSALAFENVLKKMPVDIEPEELIVGRHPESIPSERPAATTTLMPDRGNIYTSAELAAMSAGVFTSGVKTGHLTCDYATVLSKGLDGILRDIEQPRPDAPIDQSDERKAMAVAIHAAMHFIERYAVLAERLASNEPRQERKMDLLAAGRACRHISRDAPRNLHEALQLVWFLYLLECIEEGEGTAAFALGRFDQYLYPFWKSDIESGADTATLKELVACLWVKLNEFSGLQVINMTIGGSDREGKDAVNALSFVCLELMDEFRTQDPSLSVRWHKGINKRFYQQAILLATKGIGQPAFYCDEQIVRAMINAGVDRFDATDAVPGGCVELGIQGCCYPWVGNFFNIPKCLELALHNGIDPSTGKQEGPETGAAGELATFEQFYDAYRIQVGAFLDLMAHAENSIDDAAGRNMPYPFLSSIVADCIENGIDVAAGGARYNFTEVQGIGIAHVVDSLLNIKHLVYEKKEIHLDELITTLDSDFSDAEPLRRRLEAAKYSYGNHTEESMSMARRVVHDFYDLVERYENPRGGRFFPGLLVWTLYDHWADVVGALPDGRRRGDAMVSSIGPREQAGIQTPTAIIQDVTSFDHSRCAGGLTMNLRFSSSSVDDEAGLSALEKTVEVYFESGGMQLQLNVIDGAKLREAQENPDRYKDLVVRVSGFSARFVTLSRRIQDEIIERAELKTEPLSATASRGN